MGKLPATQGVPGFAYVLCEVEALKQSRGNARSLTMDTWVKGLVNRGDMYFGGDGPLATYIVYYLYIYMYIHHIYILYIYISYIYIS